MRKTDTENFQKNFSFCYFCVIIVEVEKKHLRRSARQFHRDNQFTPSQVYTQEKFTLKFYLINAIIEDKKIDVDFAPERILEKEKRRREICAGGPIDKFDVMVFCSLLFFLTMSSPTAPAVGFMYSYLLKNYV